jgi:hypothetical protein
LAREDPARFTVVSIRDIHIFIGETNPTPAMKTNFRRIGMAETPKRTAFELDTEEDSSDLGLLKLPRSDLKNNPTQPALEVEEVVEDRCESTMSNLALETLRYCLIAFAGITSGSTSNGEDSPGESILESLNKSGESDDWDSKGYDSDYYDAAMRRIEAELAQQALEEQNATAKQVFMTNKEDDAGQMMSTHFYSCRHLLGLQVQRFVEQQQVSLKWITQGLSNSGRKRSKLSLSSNPTIMI